MEKYSEKKKKRQDSLSVRICVGCKKEPVMGKRLQLSRASGFRIFLCVPAQLPPTWASDVKCSDAAMKHATLRRDREEMIFAFCEEKSREKMPEESKEDEDPLL